MAVNHELAAKYSGMQLRDTTELNQATKVGIRVIVSLRNCPKKKSLKKLIFSYLCFDSFCTRMGYFCIMMTLP